VFIVGFAKCGTTSFCDWAASHSDINFCSEKEPRFFSHDYCFNKGTEWYHSLYEQSGRATVNAEGSTFYTDPFRGTNVKAAERIFDYNPDAKIVSFFRNPFNQFGFK